MKKIKIFLDSNVLIAGLVSSKGASGTLLGQIQKNIFEIHVSKLVLGETERNLKKKLPRFLPFYFYAIENFPFFITKDFRKSNQKVSKLFSKKSDAIIFQTVQKLKPDYFLTLNRKHFHQPDIKKIATFKIRTPAQFLDEWS